MHKSTHNYRHSQTPFYQMLKSDALISASLSYYYNFQNLYNLFIINVIQPIYNTF